MRAILALEDGTVYIGKAFGAQASACGEACFNTSMTGYQEILTDPSYKGQIVTMTYPHIGNYGINRVDVESWRPHVSGFVVREVSPIVSNWRADTTLSAYLEENGIPGIQGIDTRSLTKKLRVRGAMRSFLTTEPGIEPEEAVARARAWEGLVGVDYVRKVTHPQAFDWDGSDAESGGFRLVRGNVDPGDPRLLRKPLPPADVPIVAYDFGAKYNILRKLRQSGFQVHVVPATTPASEVLKRKPAGVFLSNGPGDPSALGYAVQAA
ncbi:MAG: carbamoyl phosphate synthase small subunit, partial [Verrucomicrobiales bacterium]|nr:carbamoyl phosphate synthase small subunit [Verrucomicrobiales bacterium]